MTNAERAVYAGYVLHLRKVITKVHCSVSQQCPFDTTEIVFPDPHDVKVVPQDLTNEQRKIAARTHAYINALSEVTEKNLSDVVRRHAAVCSIVAIIVICGIIWSIRKKHELTIVGAVQTFFIGSVQTVPQEKGMPTDRETSVERRRREVLERLRKNGEDTTTLSTHSTEELETRLTDLHTRAMIRKEAQGMGIGAEIEALLKEGDVDTARERLKREERAQQILTRAGVHREVVEPYIQKGDLMGAETALETAFKQAARKAELDNLQKEIKRLPAAEQVAAQLDWTKAVAQIHGSDRLYNKAVYTVQQAVQGDRNRKRK